MTIEEQRRQAAFIAQEIADEVNGYYGRQRLIALLCNHIPAKEDAE